MGRPSAALAVGVKVSVLMRSLFPRKTAQEWLTPAGARKLSKKDRIEGVVTSIKDVDFNGATQRRVFFSHPAFKEDEKVYCVAGECCMSMSFWRAILSA